MAFGAAVTRAGAGRRDRGYTVPDPRPAVRVDDASDAHRGPDLPPRPQDGRPFSNLLPGRGADIPFTGLAPLFLFELLHEETDTRATALSPG